jgi:hypothetical protein
MSTVVELSPYTEDQATAYARPVEPDVRLERARDAARAARLSGPAQAEAHVILHPTDRRGLLRVAGELGYKTIERAGSYHLSRPDGSSMVMTAGVAGTVVDAARGSDIAQLVRAHTTSLAVAHLTGRGLEVRTATLPDGEIRIEASAPSGGGTLDMAIRPDGTATADVGCEGAACDIVARDLATATGCRIAAASRKPDYFRQAVASRQAQGLLGGG